MTNETDIYPDRIFVRDHFTDFEKLLFAQAEIKDLKKENSELLFEIGKLKSYILEVEYNTNQTLLNNHKSIKGDNRKLKDEIKKLRETNKHLTELLRTKSYDKRKNTP